MKARVREGLARNFGAIEEDAPLRHNAAVLLSECCTNATLTAWLFPGFLVSSAVLPIPHTVTIHLLPVWVALVRFHGCCAALSVAMRRTPFRNHDGLLVDGRGGPQPLLIAKGNCRVPGDLFRSLFHPSKKSILNPINIGG